MHTLSRRTFDSWEAAKIACDAIAKEAGYALAIHLKKPNKDKPTYVFLRCSKGRAYVANASVADTPADKRRKTDTQMTRCPFRVALLFDKDRRLWTVRPAGGDHNHTMTASAMTHRKYRAETMRKHEEAIVRLYNDGVKPGNIVSRLRNDVSDPDLAGIDAKIIHNTLARHRTKELAAGRTPLQ
ncbi:Transcription factor, FAR1-related protein [Ophiocordyceps camponoti-floridani]|uniref:Transcription factor, FAR1-related protein n=1 Tax=Ophiocordyceps camponoti-floridani TaxID=2030778 RepID=A0A8H4VFW2_9HYPO|nr:Transcription factor, FAR1-related protein [Ophiocordyceps camponoti-floridani]